MKKLLFFAAMMLGLASCQTEPEGLDVNVGGAVDTTITVSLPETTRANSAEGAFDNVVGSDEYTIRYIFQVFYNGTESQADRQVIYSDNKVVCFPVRLVAGRHYNFVVWADVVMQGGKNLDQLGVYEASADLHYNTAELTNITLNDTWVAMDETRDAFTGHFDTAVDGDKTPYNGAKSINIALTRPFAKLRVITTDMEQLNDLRIAPTKATVEYKVAHYNAFNAFAGEAIGDSKNRNIKHENFDIKAYGDNVNDESKVLFTDYFFANTDVVKFELTVFDQNGAVIDNTIAFNTDINVKRNHLTTIKGDILTDGNNIKVEVDEEFEKENTIFDAFVNGGTVTLDKNYDLGSTLYVKSGVKATLNLNDKTLKSVFDANNYSDVIVVEAGAELTINGDGTIEAVGGKSNFTVIVDGKLTINGGTFKSGVDENNKPNAVIYARGNGEVYVNGGNFPNEHNSTFVLNKKDADRATTTIKVRGGRFYKFNPEDNAAENPKESFLAEGCRVEADSDWFNVIYDPYYGYTKVASFDELTTAITNATTDIKIVFLNDIVGDVTLNNSHVKIINGGGKTYTGKMTLKSDVTIKNVNFDGKGYNGYAIETRGANYLTIEDCTAKNYGYGFVQTASGTVLTTIKNVTVSNVNYGVKVDYSNAVVIENADITAGVAAVLNSNYGEKPITIKNSNLNILGTWTRNNTTKTNYVFEGDNSIDTFIIDATIDNFKLAAGATLTAPNEITVTTVDGYTVEYANGKYISK